MNDDTTSHRQPMQFSLRGLLLFVAGLGFACALAPQEFWPMHIYCIAYLLVGFGQTYYSLVSWRRLRRRTAVEFASSREVAPRIHLGCWLTLPTWLLLVVLLGGKRWYHLPANAGGVLLTWLLVASVSQFVGLWINLGNLRRSVRSIDGALRTLALLNVAHGILCGGGSVVLPFLAADFD